MFEKMVEMFTPEIMTIAITALVALTLLISLMVLIKIVSLSRVKKRLLIIEGKSLGLEETQAAFRQDRQRVNNTVANLTEAADKIESVERRLDEFDNKIAHLAEVADKIESIERHSDELDHKITENYNQLAGQESKLSEHDALLGQAGQMMGEKALDFKQAVQRIHSLEEEFQDIKGFKRAFEQTRNRILNVLGAMLVEMPPQNTPTTEQNNLKEETYEGKLPDAEDFHKSRMR